MPADSLRIATEAYYWKPGKAFFEAVEVEQYAHAGIRFAHAVLDLGCGDGTFGAMLRSRGVLDGVDIALDYAMKPLSSVHKHTACGLVQADARALPLRQMSTASVLANSTLAGVRGDVERAIVEVSRVLQDQGLLVLSVPTPRFAEELWLPKLLRKVGAVGMSRRFLARALQRLGLYTIVEEEEWRQRLEACQFRIEHVAYYCTRRHAIWFNLLNLHLMRGFAVVKVIRLRWVKQLSARLQESIFRPLVRAEVCAPKAHTKGQAGMLLILARKTGAGAHPRG